MLLSEVEKRQSRGNFEGSQLGNAGNSRLDLLDQAYQGLMGHRREVDLDALGIVEEMWRSIKAYTQPGSLKTAGDQSTGGTLALGACNMDGRIAILRVCELCHQGPHAVEVEIGL